jgi:hypothetical protein
MLEAFSCDYQRLLGLTRKAQTRQSDSNVRNKITQPHLQRVGDFHQSIERGVPDAALDVAHENRAQISLLGETFLAQSGFFPVGANPFTKEAAVFLDWHSPLPNQEARGGTIKHALRLLLHRCTSRVETAVLARKCFAEVRWHGLEMKPNAQRLHRARTRHVIWRAVGTGHPRLNSLSREIFEIP